MNLPEFSIRRPVTTTLIMVAILLFGIIGFRLLPVSDLPNVDFPIILVTAALPGANPETMASAVATPLEKQFSTIAGIDSMTSDQRHRGHADHAPVQPEPQHRRRRAGRAGGDQRRPAAAAAEHARAALVPEGQPGRPADPVPRAHLADAAALDARRVRRDAHGAAHLDGQRRGAGARLSARRSTPCGSSSTRRAGAPRASGSTRWPTRCSNANVNLPTGTLYGDGQGVHRPGHRPAHDAPAVSADSSSPTATARPCACDEIGTVIDSVENNKIAGWYINGSARSSWRSSASRAPTRSRWPTPSRRCCRRSSAQLPASVKLHMLYDRSVTIRDVGARREVHAGADARAGGAGDLPVPAQRLGHGHPEPGAADVDHRHVRGDVPAGLQPRQPLADGADAGGRLRGRRRDRHAREHRPAHGDGQDAHAGRARRRRARSASRSSR